MAARPQRRLRSFASHQRPGLSENLVNGLRRFRFRFPDFRLSGFVSAPELADVVGQASIADLQSNFVQPCPDVLQTVPGGQQISDVWPCLPDLARLSARFFPQSFAEAV